ncbi:hypothetical protein KC320_g17 [Hortaea werneckii]|nr:hypothetical protein KC320_g17 [Hortaea werneckii]
MLVAPLPPALPPTRLATELAHLLASAPFPYRLVLVLAADGLNSLLHGLAARGERQTPSCFPPSARPSDLNLPELVLPFLRLRLLFSRVLHALKLLHTLFPFGDLPLDLVRGGASDGNDTTNALCNARFLQDDQVLDLGGVLDMNTDTDHPHRVRVRLAEHCTHAFDALGGCKSSIFSSSASEHPTTSLVHLLTQHFPQCKVKDVSAGNRTSCNHIKVCAVEDQADLLAFGSSRGCVNERIDVVDIELNQVTTGLLLTLTGFPGFLLRLSNRIFVNRQASFLGHNACEIDWKAFCAIFSNIASPLSRVLAKESSSSFRISATSDCFFLISGNISPICSTSVGSSFSKKLPISTLKYFLAYRAPLRRMRRTTYPRPTLFGTPPSDIANARVRM